jgi:hypothetical protein
MIAKWLGLIEAGRIAASGGGSIPLGDATVWNSITNWTDFGTIPGPLRVGDLVLVTDLLPGFGIAQYNGSDWELRQALFPTKADLEAFPELVGTGAIANVGTGVETDPIYYSDGTTWFRTPDGTRYIYPNEPDWASLPTEDTILNDDEVGVDDLGTPHSSGTAQRHGGNEWRLIKGRFASVSDAQAFDALYPVETGAIALIKDGGMGHGVESIAYRYGSGAWQRFGSTTTQGFAWTLTESQALTGADPSGIGALKDGDFGIYTPANGAPIVLRFKEACDVAFGAGGGTRPVWMIPEAYAGTPEVVAYLTGSETGVLATTLAAQGWTVTTTGVGTVTLNGGYVRCAGTANVNGSAQVATSATWLGSQRFCVQGLLRGSAGGSDPYVGLLQLNNNDIQYTFMRGNLSGAFRHFTLSSAPAWTAVDSLNSLPSPTLNLDGTTPWFFQAIGRTLAENAETRIDGELYGSMRRNLDTATTASAMNLALYANSGGSGTVSTLDSKTLTILTY